MANRKGSKRKLEARARIYTIRLEPSKFEALKAIAPDGIVSKVIYQAIAQYLKFIETGEKAA